MSAYSTVISLISGSTVSQILLLIVILVSVYFFLSKKSNLPPGPWSPIPYIGYALNIAYVMYKGKSLYKFLVELGQKYGNVYSFTVFGIPLVVLNDHQVIREAFQDVKLNDRGDNKLVARLLSRSYNKWEDMGPYRVFVLSCFRKFGIGTSRFEEPINKESTYLIDELSKLKGQPEDLTWYFHNAVSNVINQVVFGTRFELSDERFRRHIELLKRANEVAGSGGLEALIPIDIPNKVTDELYSIGDEVHEFINKMIESHRKDFDPDNLNDVIDMWLNEIRLHRSDDPDSFQNPDNIPGQIFLLFQAGMDSTASTLRWGTQYLVRHPEVQNRIHREIDTEVGRNRLPQLTDKPNLPYTQAFIAELLRIVSLVPLAAFHVAGDTTSLRGYTIPKDSVVISNLYAVMHSPEIWGDPEEFRPERFLDNEGYFHETDEVVPFGLGRRSCLGEALARQELFIFFTHLTHQFKFEKTSEDAPMPTLKRIDGIVTHPEGYKLRVIKRD